MAEEQIGEVRTVKSLGHEDHAKELYLSAASATYKTRVLLALVTAPLEGIVDSLFSGSLVLCFFIGTIATLDGRLEPAFLVSFMLLVNTTACKCLSSRGCVAHTDGAVFQANNLRDNLGKCFEMVPEFAGEPPTISLPSGLHSSQDASDIALQSGAIGAAARIFELVDHRSSVNYVRRKCCPSRAGLMLCW